MSSNLSQTIDIGRTVGSYRIDSLLGAGGMGVVYLAHDCELRRRVAIKVVDRRRCNPNAVGLLLQEARAAAALNHPSICGVHEVGRAGGEPFIVMEHVAGSPLSAIVSREPLSIETVIHYSMQMADAIAHAHEHGVVHGDLKSANVMIEPDGRVKILDFGLAVQRKDREPTEEDTTRPSGLESCAGTVPYMAPEQLRGQMADARSDIWALGVVMFEMLAGCRPFRGETLYDLAASILHDHPDRLPRRVPIAFGSLIGRCLSKCPSDRFASGRQLAAALDDLA
jgi:serine/threonine protein kinase